MVNGTGGGVGLSMDKMNSDKDNWIVLSVSPNDFASVGLYMESLKD